MSSNHYSTQFKPSIKPVINVKSQPQDPTKVPTNIDLNTTILFSPEPLPDEIISAVPLLHSLGDDNLQEISVQIIQHILKVTSSLDDDISADEDFIALQKLLQLQDMKEQFSTIYTSFYRFLRVILRNKIPQSKVKEGLLQLNVPSIVTEVVVKAAVSVRNNKVRLNNFQNNIICRWPTVTNLKWRVDVVISSGSLSRVMRPTILMRMFLSNGRIKTFAISIEQFHQLRYATAKLLYDMQSIERHPIMRIVNEYRVKELEDLAK